MERFGKYEILEKIGEGGFGIIYKGYDPLIKRTVAIKTCTSDDPEIRDRFFREAQISGNLQHRNITIVYDFGMERNIPYLIQEYLGGEDLHRKIRRGEQIPFGTQLLLLIQAARGLQHAHQNGVVHRDIKPSNVRILDDGVVKIMDFGIAKVMSSEALTQTGETIGTAAYLSPEQIRGEDIDHRADIFAFGTLAYELISGQRAFVGENPSTVLYQVLSAEPPALSSVAPLCPPAMEAIVSRCLEKNPERRYPDCGQLLADLGALLDLGDAPPAGVTVTGSIIAPPSARPLSGSIHTGATMPLTPRSATALDEIPLEGFGSAPDTDVHPSRSRTLGVLMMFLVVAGLGAGSWWYSKGYRPSWIPATGASAAATVDAADGLAPASEAPPPAIRGTQLADGLPGDDADPHGQLGQDDRADLAARAPEGQVSEGQVSEGQISEGQVSEGQITEDERLAQSTEQPEGSHTEADVSGTDSGQGSFRLVAASDAASTRSAAGSDQQPFETVALEPLSEAPPPARPATTPTIRETQASFRGFRETSKPGETASQLEFVATLPALLTVRQSPGSRPVWVVANGQAIGWTPLQDTQLEPGNYDVGLYASPDDSQSLYREPVLLRPGYVKVLTFDTGRQLLAVSERAWDGTPGTGPGASEP